MKDDFLLNTAATKKYIRAQVKRFCPALDISGGIAQDALDNLNVRVKLMIQSDVKSHRTKGKRYNP